MQTIFVWTCPTNDLVFINLHEVERLSPNNVTQTDVWSDPGRIYNNLVFTKVFLTSLLHFKLVRLFIMKPDTTDQCPS